MPRIDPFQLLKCLSVLLSPEGGILSQDEVPRLVNLMTKFSKKLVSKCVYILILKSTEQSLVNLFMAEGGWNLIHTWLQDAIQISNWDLVREILSLLLVTPVDVERLKLNNIPKLVKSLSRLDEVKGVQELSTQLVHDWLVIVKGNTKVEEVVKPQIVEVAKTETAEISAPSATTVENVDTVDASHITISSDDSAAVNEAIPTQAFYKVTLRDGKQVISRAASAENSEQEIVTAEAAPLPEPSLEVIEKKEPKEKEKKSEEKPKSSSSNSDKSKSKSRSSSSSKHSSSSSSSRPKSSSSKDKDRHKSSSSKSSSRDKDRDRKDKANGAKTSSSSSKDKSESKEKQAEKDKDTLAKIKPQSIDKLGRIPKKTDDKKENKEVKKPTMSIEVRKTEERPKTVKVFNSKRRSTGLEEEAKPPPPRPTKKPPPPVVLPQKRPSPVKEMPTPPEKKFKLDKVDIPERPGAIKLIPPKPKPSVLQESDIFMDALAASATSKKEPKKRKRRPSVTKDTPSSPTTSQEPQTPTSPITSPTIGLKNIAAANFYQDTLQNEETTEEKTEEPVVERSGTPIDNTGVEIERPKLEGGLKGALVYTKKKGPKKSVKFNDNNLTQVRYFELDETERVNVTKNFMDMAKMEMTSEREALQMSRKLPNEDTMEPQTMWRFPYVIDQPDPLAAPGCKSLEKDIQFAREKSVLQALYFDKRKIPDSPEEPVPETHQMNDPITIPLEDADSQEMDLRNTPWPEPKGSPPHMQENLPPQIFSNIPIPFQSFPPGGPPAFQGMPPRFNGPFGGPNMLPNGNMMGPPPPEMMHQGPLNPNAFGPGPDNFNNPMMNDSNFNNMPFNPPNMGMFPPNNFNMNRGGGRGGFGGGGGNNGPWIRMNGPGNWNRGGGRGRLCKNVKNHGFCRNMDKCPFIHPK